MADLRVLWIEGARAQDRMKWKAAIRQPDFAVGGTRARVDGWID